MRIINHPIKFAVLPKIYLRPSAAPAPYCPTTLNSFEPFHAELRPS